MPADRETLVARLRAHAEWHEEWGQEIRRLKGFFLNGFFVVADYSDQTAALLREAADALEAAAWQPIETAPRGERINEGYWGPWILAWGPEWETPALTRWRFYHRVDAWCFSESNEEDDYADVMEAQPTHWRPLPDPPSKLRRDHLEQGEASPSLPEMEGKE